ncbi:uncharacterized protein FIBRA_01542 [Fibroporia radiculosa]|uniref:Geranylgeranyl pyrophosphate synthetase n=1 Tax=Fibroporia radiculosa TaxID=599839 RepID=J4H188_9APHY|nr:uncharacterized protein FIBRA_01542 [Fibroporia radiculosa]CCL99524.1 predicted protein [Fibroporia radiculosa]
MSYRGNRRGYVPRRGGHHSASAQPIPPDRELAEGLLSPSIKVFEKPEDLKGKDIVIQDLKYLGSYNWVDVTTKATMIVPGSPPFWRNRPLPYSVPRDSGIRIVDQASNWFPSCPLFPLLRAVDIVAEDNGDTVDWSSVDFITDRNNLRKLLRWILDTDGTAREFRIDTQLVGKRTVLFNIWHKNTKERTDPTIWTYGYNFEHESTVRAAGCEIGIEHDRIVRYNFDGLTLVVRFEVDACLVPTSELPQSSTSSVSAETLSLMMSSLNVSGSANRTVSIDSNASTSDLDIIRAGSQVPQDSLVEMTTRSKNYLSQFNWTDAYPQLSLSATPHHFLAVHNRGLFQSIRKRKLGDDEMMNIDARAQPGFRRLRDLLGTIQELVIEHGRLGRLSLVHKGGILQVFERADRGSCLPEPMMGRFEA